MFGVEAGGQEMSTRREDVGDVISRGRAKSGTTYTGGEHPLA
jgi:hypothetical protein